MNWYLKVLRQYADFNSRARRQEYWMFVLFNIIFSIAASLVDRMLGNPLGIGIVSPLYLLIMFIPGLAVSIRRLHDIGKSGWMLLIVLIPFIGAIWLLILMVMEGQPGNNMYGANPKNQ